MRSTPSAHVRPLLVAVFASAALLATAACPGNVSHTYKSFESAVDRGASCSELFDQRANFESADTLARIDSELVRIGCTSADATRTDR